MALPALPLLLVAAAGLAAGWAGRTLVGRLRGRGRAIDDDAAAGLGRTRPVRTLAWCDACHAHMAPGHACRPARPAAGDPPDGAAGDPPGAEGGGPP